MTTGAYLPQAEPSPRDNMPEPRRGMDKLLSTLIERGGSDLHIVSGYRPYMRVRGQLQEVAGVSALTAPIVEKLLRSILQESEWNQFQATKELDTSYSLEGVSRFRVNVAMERGKPCAVIRAIPFQIKPLSDLGMPPVISTFSDFARGLVLVTGPTGSGKSTTLASIIDLINQKYAHRIVTIEDPVEFVHDNKKSVITQREVGKDTDSFAAALKRVLRQDPDVILVGEMRDQETISTALTAAETGHLVFGTLHTSSAKSTISRIVDVFPAGEQAQVRTMLATSLRAVVCQTLCETASKDGRVPALEIMVVNNAIRNNMQTEGGINQIDTYIQSGKKEGNQTLDDHLFELAQQARITAETAILKANDKPNMRKRLSDAGHDI